MTYPVRYDPDTGVLFWLRRDDVPAWWNTRYAGKPCGALIQGYIRFHYDGKLYLAHRMAWFLHHGYWPDELDHANGNKTDNRLSNLRDISHAENMANQTYQSRPLLGLKRTRNGKWQARAGNGGRVHLGTFSTEAEARAARNAAVASMGYGGGHVA